MEDKKFKVFKEIFSEIAKNEFNACKTFIDNLDSCKDTSDVIQLIYRHADDIGERLDFYSDDITDLEVQVSVLEDEIDELTYKLEEAKEPLGDTLYDEMKFELFLKYAHKFTPWELEEILSK